MADEQQFDSIPKRTRDGYPVRQGIGVMPGGPDTYVAYGRGWAQVSNTPFREYKHWTHEGGISTPLITHWPAGVAAGRHGQLENQPGQLVDIMATCLDAAGAAYPSELHGEKIKPLEGTSLLPAFVGKSIQRTRPLVWEHEGNRAVRDENWKLVAKENQPWELYDLAADRSELHDLAASNPVRVKQMAATWDAWAARANVLPLGTWRGKGGGNADVGSKELRFALKAGDHLDRSEAPAISGRGFTIRAKFEVSAMKEGVIVAQGGSSLGYALFIADGKLQFTVRNRTQVANASSTALLTGAHTAMAHVNNDGVVTLTVDDQPVATGSTRVIVSAMPADGLDVGSDEGGAVGPYTGPNPFKGRVEWVNIEVNSK